MDEEKIREEALVFAKKNKIRLARQLTNKAVYAPDKFPVSVFMAGSPGAGKTEFSKSIIQTIERNNKGSVVRIDGDEIRSLLPGYNGTNSRLFQGAISLIVEKIHDLLLHNKQSFIFDSTFTKYDKAVDNIRRSIDKNRIIFIFYVYQKPDVAWQFTKAREIKEGRNIPKSAFIEEFIAARETVKRIIETFGPVVDVFLVKKDFITNTVESVSHVDSTQLTIDQLITDTYTKDELEKIL